MKMSWIDKILHRKITYREDSPSIYFMSKKMVGVLGIEPRTSCSQNRRATAALRPAARICSKSVVPPGRLELPLLAPEASALSAELRGQGPPI